MASPLPLCFVVLGGGVAGVSCAEELLTMVNCRQGHVWEEIPKQSRVDVLLISAGATMKVVKSVSRFGKLMQEVEIEEITATNVVEHLASKPSSSCRLKFLQRHVSSVDAAKRLIHFKGDYASVPYFKLCLCTGAVPRHLPWRSSRILSIRDTDSVHKVVEMLKDSRRTVVVGNGGISMEAVWSMRSCEVVWVMRDKSVGITFLDKAASAFLVPELFPEHSQESQVHISSTVDSTPVTTSDSSPLALEEIPPFSDAAAMSWTKQIREAISDSTNSRAPVHIEMGVNVVNISDEPIMQNSQEFPVTVRLSNGHVYGADMIIAATGVRPAVHFLGDEFERSTDGGVLVDCGLQTSVPHVYAAGDCASFPNHEHPLWFQMRLWSQGRVMGMFAAHSMCDDIDLGVFIELEMFSHVTHLFGKKVVLLGCFNAQGLGQEGIDYSILVRMKPGQEFIKLVLQKGKIVGAVLIGDTDLEETMENLILSHLDLSCLGDDILREDVDLADFFD